MRLAKLKFKRKNGGWSDVFVSPSRAIIIPGVEPEDDKLCYLHTENRESLLLDMTHEEAVNEINAAFIEDGEEKNCTNCEYFNNEIDTQPCKLCIQSERLSEWKPIKETEE